MRAGSRLVLTCEHASARVPGALKPLFRGADATLRSHRGSDIGALVLAEELGGALRVPVLAGDVSRLVVDLNRSEDRPGAFSRWTRELPPTERERLLARHWRPHRARVERAVATALDRGGRPVLHLGVHSFTPRFRGVTRRVDVALLYDPARRGERAFAAAWLAALHEQAPDLRLRRNHPYRGTADGLTTALRGRFRARDYLGVELEVNQRFPRAGRSAWPRLRATLAATLLSTLERGW